ncbi:putative serine/threonine protein kinase [Actinoplanes friuliensis DSM 7358]|uniref:non-specific serine/threonine protein kinase n=1 Tax=Actinoplanes friuliensis DSM 7358 TaxID=1246995 RepID=U5VZ82_9ACTN|nr:putative serine/threonine protein kinase [Actinoplanes friuliensis DSM 7358]
MLQVGQRLGGRYRLEVRIGAGGMGEVWRAVDEVLGRVVAVKAMLPRIADQPDFARRFLVEAKAMASVNHGAVAAIHDYGSDDGITFLVMEFIDGESLSQLLGRAGRLGAADTMHLIAQAADGLQAVHDRGIVHRDIKPANLLVRRDGSLLITDFGISRTHDGTQLTVSGAVLGTPTYLSPEQVLGRPATAQSDVYSLGLAAYECLAGQRPFGGENPYAVALQRLQAGPPPLGADVPRAVAAVVDRALAIEPADRWQSAAELATAARAAMHGGSPQAVAVRRRAVPGRRWAIAAICLVILVVGGVTAWQVFDTGESPSIAGAPVSNATPPGLEACGPVFCPVEPLCWSGLTSISGRAEPPWPADCAESHVWETFAAFPPPAAAAKMREDELMTNEAVAGVCTAALMSSRSQDRTMTEGWVRDGWPIRVDGGGPRLIHCLARPESGETTGAAF